MTFLHESFPHTLLFLAIPHKNTRTALSIQTARVLFYTHNA